MSSKPVFLPGASQSCSNLTEAAILSRITDSFVRGSREPLSVKSLAEEAMAPTHEVASALQKFVDAGLIAVPDESQTGLLSSFRVTGAIIQIEPTQNNLPGFAQEPMLSRGELGSEKVSAGGFDYLASVTIDSGKAFLTISQVDEDTQPIRILVDEKPFDDAEAAWSWWDDYRRGLEHPVLAWLDEQLKDNRDESGAPYSDFAVDEPTEIAIREALQVNPLDRAMFMDTEIYEDEGGARWPGLDNESAGLEAGQTTMEETTTPAPVEPGALDEQQTGETQATAAQPSEASETGGDPAPEGEAQAPGEDDAA